MRNNIANSNGLTLNPPSAMPSNYSLVLPNIPSVTSIMALDTAGNITAPYTVDNSTINISSNQIQVAPGGITATQIQAGYGLVPTGSIMDFAGLTAPAQYLMCDGTAYSRTTYALLYGVISTYYGQGDGSTTFNVPDFRWLSPRGFGGSVGGTISAVSGNSLTITAHNFNRSGVQFYFTGSVPNGLSAGTTYWTIWIDVNTIQVGSTLANAIAGTAISLSSSTTGGVAIPNLDPDMSSRVQYAPGSNSGNLIGSLQYDQFLDHNHYMGAFYNYVYGGGQQGNPSAAGYGPAQGYYTSGTGGNETRGKNLYVNKIIKY